MDLGGHTKHIATEMGPRMTDQNPNIDPNINPNIDPSNTSREEVGGNREPSSAPPPAAVFCQNCGKPLDRQSARVVGTAVFCEPCLAARLHGSATVPPGASAGAGGFQAGAWTSNFWPSSGIASSTPDPGLATLLGFIPGVGAMYNEQYAKGIVHLIVFAVLVSLVNANGIFLLFVFGWVFYMAIEAHHTAQARRDGTPLPNPFGLNDIGERLGFGRAWPAGSRFVPPGATAPPAGAHAPNAGSAGATGGSTAAEPGFPGWNPGWNQERAGSAPPVQEVPGWGAPVDEYPYASRPGEQSAYGVYEAGQSASAPGYTSAYDRNYVPPSGTQTPPYGYGPCTAPPYNATYVPPIPGDPAYVVPPSRFPAGAVWLIGLGTIFLLTTTGIFDIFPGGILVGFLLIGLGVWVFLRRMLETGAGLASNGTPEYSLRLFRAARGAVWLILLGLLLLLNDFHVLSWHRSWPLFIIVAGVMTLLERAVWSTASSSFAPPAAGFTPPGPAASSLSVVPTHDPSDGSEQDAQKGGR